LHCLCQKGTGVFLVLFDDNIVASDCTAFARPSSSANLDFLSVKLPTTNLAQAVHPKKTKPQALEEKGRHTSP